ncbi:MAG: L-threonylcarbamoyladenylate synthase [Syntrophorhabdales bacterium]|jgi:L-threonylcarbamoyladenylate synthase
MREGRKTELLDGFDARAISRAVFLLKKGGLVAFPTETVYGLGADAYNARAVARIFELKKRPRFDPLIVHIARKEWVGTLARFVPAKAGLLMDRFWPGPLTIILEKTDIIPDIVTAGLPTVGIRMPGHPVALDLIGRLERPIAAPSANPFGYMSTTTAADVARLFDERLPLILDGGPASYGIESTIVSVRGDEVRLHRHGSVSIEELQTAVGEVREKETDGTGGAPEAPGELPYHYAPHAPLCIIGSPSEIEVENSAFLAFRAPGAAVRSAHVRVLSERGDMREAAARFFSYLIALDRTGVDLIYAETIPEKGLGRAIMERLRKAERKTACANH